MYKFHTYRRFGSAHNVYVGSISANSAKEAFALAVNKYFDVEHYSKCTEFYVETLDKDEKISDYDRSYGSDHYGQKENRGFRSSLKLIIDNVFYN